MKTFKITYTDIITKMVKIAFRTGTTPSTTLSNFVKENQINQKMFTFKIQQI